eukprot:CAMPEP_0184696078 /NCGR_PEP_ID=MMETSP0313-20130426/3494_1 /TAXON_ID=2792 /ORGANISM="Porphyridium aerugineum, Strain SAG 1380-2" /LENGTH=42 /DNA_ID= /DNA_START= /DNA_END= /DNA_ORIENTATION=
MTLADERGMREGAKAAAGVMIASSQSPFTLVAKDRHDRTNVP